MFYRKQTSKKKAQEAIDRMVSCLGQMLSESKRKSCMYRYIQVTVKKRSSELGRGADALALWAEERRDKLRKAAGRCT